MVMDGVEVFAGWSVVETEFSRKLSLPGDGDGSSQIDRPVYVVYQLNEQAQ